MSFLDYLGEPNVITRNLIRGSRGVSFRKKKMEKTIKYKRKVK